MKRFSTVLVLSLSVVTFMAGCGGDKGSGNGSSENSSGDGDSSGSRVRFASAFSAKDDMSDGNEMKQMGLAIHNSHDVYRKLPMFMAMNSKEFNPKLSWRVMVLPFLEHSPLYDEFDKKQPWDHEKNKSLIEKGKDSFTLSNGNLICAIKHDKPPQGLRDIRDGMSNTIMLLENPNANGEQWTQPKDIPIDDAVKLIKSLKKNEFLLGLRFDGSLAKIYSPEGKELKDEDIKAIFGYEDAMQTNDEVFRPSK